MENASKTLYLWDLADTLFGERWDAEKTGLANFDDYITSLGYNLNKIDAKTYEWNYEKPFKEELIELSLLPGFTETLSWTDHNAVFTTGNREQIDWRAEVFLKKRPVDIRPFFETIYSTFDFGNFNNKTQEMFFDILKRELAKGYSAIVYVDNKLENCRQFQEATAQIRAIGYRIYHINAGAAQLTKLSANFFEVPDLFKLLENEQSVTSTNPQNTLK